MSLSGSPGPGPNAPQTLGDVPESAVLARIFPRLPVAVDALLGPGDDAAVVRAADGRFVVTTDAMVHGPDFRLAWSTPFDLGWKAAATNLADVAAMGAWPTAMVVALAAPTSTPLDDLDRFSDGLREACAALAPGCGVVGGDLSVSDTFTIAITAFGDLGGREPVLRSGAQVGDVVAVCGELGLAAEGLRMLFEQAVDASGTPDPRRAQALRTRGSDAVEAQLAPSPPIRSGVEAARAGAHAMMDVSDGLALDASRLAEASGVVIDLDGAALRSASAGGDLRLALTGGEDHGMLATFAPGAPLPTGFRVIGRVIAGDGAGGGGGVGGVGGVGGGDGEGGGGAGDAAGADDEGRVRVDGAPFQGRAGWNPYDGWDGGVG